MSEIKQRINDFFHRLATASYIILGRKCYFMDFSWESSDEYVFRSAAYSAASDYLKLLYADSDEYFARINMLRAVLNTKNSIITQWKENGVCHAAYDCASKEIFNELRNQELIKK